MNQSPHQCPPETADLAVERAALIATVIALLGNQKMLGELELCRVRSPHPIWRHVPLTGVTLLAWPLPRHHGLEPEIMFSPRGSFLRHWTTMLGSSAYLLINLDELCACELSKLNERLRLLHNQNPSVSHRLT